MTNPFSYIGLLILIFTFIFGTFLLGISPSVFGGDSGDVVLSAWFGGIAHAPGYPLNAIIGWVFTHFPIGRTVAYRADLMAAFFQSVTVVFVFIIVRRLTNNSLVALASCVTLAFSFLFWLYAHTLEVFQLNALLVALSVLLLTYWRFLKKKSDLKNVNKFLYFAVFFFGLAVFHHQTSILLVPAYIYLILSTDSSIKRSKSTILKLVIVFLLGFLPFLYLPLASLRDIPTNWDDATKLSNFINLITRGDYGTFVPTSSLIGSNLLSRMTQIANYFLFVKTDFSLLGLILIVIGSIYLFLKERAIFWFTTLAVLFSGPFFLFYSSFPFINDFYSGLWERFLMLSYFFLIFYLAYGFKFVYDVLFYLFNRSHLTLKIKFLLPIVLVIVLLLLPINLFSKNRYKTDLSKFLLGDWVGEDILASAAENSLIFLQGDTITFNTEYVFYTKNVSRSFKLIRVGSLGDYDYRLKIFRSIPNLNYPPDFLEQKKEGIEYYVDSLIASNKGMIDIYFVGPPLNVKDYKWTQIGLLRKLMKEGVSSTSVLFEENKALFSNFKYKFASGAGYEHFMTSHLKEIYYQPLIGLSSELLGKKAVDDADFFIREALLLFPDGKDANAMMGNRYFVAGDCRQAEYYFSKVSSLDKKDLRPLQALVRVYKECLKDEQGAKVFEEKLDSLSNNKQEKLN